MSYKTEREGQIEFFKQFGIPYDTDDSVLSDNTDGVWNGNLIEFKLSIKDPNKTLFQAVKYLSHMRIKGESIPATILLIDLNANHIYQYRSEDCRNDIQKVYIGAASKENEGFSVPDPVNEYDYDEMLDASKVRKLFMPKRNIEDEFIPVDIDEDCIVGYANRYYSECPKATKADFLGDAEGTKNNVLGEIREPKHFKGIIRPYKGETNEKFKYLMDCLNDKLSKKDLGAFYTNFLYASKACELVVQAVNNVPEGNDYIILDRCAGSGNLQQGLVGLYDKNGDELISHCVVSTYEYFEYKVLLERLGSGAHSVREIIPPTESRIEYESGHIKNADAMSKEYIDNPIIKQYVDNPNCTVIMFENPPYRDLVADNSKKSGRKIEKSFVFNEFKEHLREFPNSNISTARDLSNQFIWSAFKYYLRQPTDAYILFSPVKYWKTLGLCNKKFVDGYLFNRKHFHASASAIACIYWQNENDGKTEAIDLEAYDIDSNNKLVDCGTLTCKKCHDSPNVFMFYMPDDKSQDVPNAVYCESNGTEAINRKCEGQSYYNENFVGYLYATGFGIDPKHVNLLRSTYFGIRGYYLRDKATKTGESSYIRKLPIFCAKWFPLDRWYEKDFYANSADKVYSFAKDKDFLKSCLIYTCLSNKNKCLTFDGSDGRHYQNELCFDEGTVASRDLAKMTLDCDETELIKLWTRILEQAKTTANYNPDYTYGVYQITKELNTFTVVKHGKSNTKVYDYPMLNGNLNTLRTKLKEYYLSHIKEKMFKYELVK